MFLQEAFGKYYRWQIDGLLRSIAFINEAGTVTKILDYIGEPGQPLGIVAARGLPLWEAAAGADAAGNEPQWDASAQPGPEFQFDQRIAW